MYNNLPQQTPYYYGYGMQMPQYQRVVNPNQEQAQNTSPVAAPYQVVTPNYIKGRPVVSIDEARASQIDLDGSLFVFPDLGNKKIYTKQINLDGTATFNVFELAPQAPQKTEPQPVYVTKEELDTILAEFKASLSSVPAQKIKPAQQSFNL